jgi:MoxR-like ATPase
VRSTRFSPRERRSQTRDLFSGRKEQLGRAIEAVTAPGRHPIVFGQRGVGKTSLANVLDDVLQGLNTIKVSCDGGDSFATIWNRVFGTASVNFKQQAMGFNREDAIRTINLGELLGHDPQTVKPAEVGELLANLRSGYSVVILDEFDKITDRRSKSAFAGSHKNPV